MRAAGKERGLKPLTVVVLDAGGLVPVRGGVLVKDEAGVVLCCVGVSGYTSDNDELAAVTGITSASLVPQPD